MHMTLTPRQAADMLRKASPDDWTYGGAVAVCEEIEAGEGGSGSVEFDALAITSEWSEYSSAHSAAEDMSDDYKEPEREEYEDDDEYEERREEEALEHLRERTSVVTFGDGVVVRQF